MLDKKLNTLLSLGNWQIKDLGGNKYLALDRGRVRLIAYGSQLSPALTHYSPLFSGTFYEGVGLDGVKYWFDNSFRLIGSGSEYKDPISCLNTHSAEFFKEWDTQSPLIDSIAPLKPALVYTTNKEFKAIPVISKVSASYITLTLGYGYTLTHNLTTGESSVLDWNGELRSYAIPDNVRAGYLDCLYSMEVDASTRCIWQGIHSKETVYIINLVTGKLYKPKELNFKGAADSVTRFWSHPMQSKYYTTYKNKAYMGMRIGKAKCTADSNMITVLFTPSQLHSLGFKRVQFVNNKFKSIVDNSLSV